MSTEMRRGKRGALWVLAILVIVPAVAVLLLWLHHRHARTKESQARNESTDRGPVVMVAPADMSPAARDIVLPADVRALYQASVYAKVAGYVKAVRVDKGDAVKKGQLIGNIESPDTDQAVAQARSDLLLRRAEAKRARALAPEILSQADLDTAVANLRVAEANLQRARETKRYEDLIAPFDGIVTARYVDPGTLLPAALASTTAALPIVDIADPSTIRVQTYVGADAAAFVKVGDEVTIWEDARPDKPIPAPITRTAGALDPRTRTMLVEIEIDNREHRILPGTFAHARIRLSTPPSPLVPAEAVLVRAGKTMVAVVSDDRVHLVEVKTGVSDGRVVQVTSGLRGSEIVALNLPTETEDGAPVQAKRRKQDGEGKSAGAGAEASARAPEPGPGASAAPRPGARPAATSARRPAGDGK